MRANFARALGQTSAKAPAKPSHGTIHPGSGAGLGQTMRYEHYAPFYDGSGQLRFAVLMAQYLREVLARHPAPGRHALDLACGTGTLALALADDGWQVVGLDESEAMLAQARAKAAMLDTTGRATFVRGDMRSIPFEDQKLRIERAEPGAITPPSLLNLQFDLVTCVYDSLNYLLTEAELTACFDGVARALAPGGLFFGDMNTRYFLEHDWGEYEVLELPGFVQVSQSHFDPTTACSAMMLTGFVGDDERGYERFDETHIERAYPAETIAGLLTAAGLVVEGCYACFTFQPIAERTQRVAWVARKPEQRAAAG